MSKNYPLAVELGRGELTIRIGIETLAWAFNNRPSDQDPEDPNTKRVRVVNAAAFAKDVLRALTKEDESGQSAVNQMLDDAMDAAVDDGAQGLAR